MLSESMVREYRKAVFEQFDLSISRDILIGRYELALNLYMYLGIRKSYEKYRGQLRCRLVHVTVWITIIV